VNNLDEMAEQIRKELAAKDEAREKMLPLCREAIRYSGNAIRAIHRHEFDEAMKLLQSAHNQLTEAEKAVAEHSELANTGAIRDAQKELAEASITLALVTDKPIPKPDTLGVDVAAYLNGLGEAVGELRRFMLDSMRQGDLSRGEGLLSVMDDIYSVLVTMDFPDALTAGLRRTTDMVRGVLERTRSDLTLAIRQKTLEARLAEFQKEEIQQEDLKETDQQYEEEQDDHQEEPELDSIEQELYKELDEWRSQKANEENLAPFIIAHNAFLKQIIKLRPKTMRELNGVKGFGERRINKYGREILFIINKGR
jgi:translin